MGAWGFRIVDVRAYGIGARVWDIWVWGKV